MTDPESCVAFQVSEVDRSMFGLRGKLFLFVDSPPDVVLRLLVVVVCKLITARSL